MPLFVCVNPKYVLNPIEENCVKYTYFKRNILRCVLKTIQRILKERMLRGNISLGGKSPKRYRQAADIIAAANRLTCSSKSLPPSSVVVVTAMV